MIKSKNTSRILLLLIGFAFTLSIGFYLGMSFFKNQESNYGVIIAEGPKLEEIQNATDEFLEAYNNGDLNGIGNTYAKDAIFMPPNLPSIHGRSEIMRFFQEEVISNKSKMKIAETVQEVIYFEDWAVMRGLGEIAIKIPDATSNKIPFKWAMLSKINPDGKWESVWDLYNDM
jgi:ketosteroid isomerase-like protein